MRLPEIPTRIRACRSDSSTPRSVTSVDQCPSPNRAVSAPAAAFCKPAITGTSVNVAFRNFTRCRAAAVDVSDYSPAQTPTSLPPQLFQQLDLARVIEIVRGDSGEDELVTDLAAPRSSCEIARRET